MRRLVVIAMAALFLSLEVVSTTSADNGPHGSYSATTDKCAACHRAHTAAGDSLLAGPATSNDRSEFCYTCHNGGAGAYTDVKNGLFLSAATVVPGYESTVITNTDRPLLGGGFESVRMNAALTGTLSLPATPSHMVTGGSNTVWGFGNVGANDAGAGSISLTCTNCHNPHGGAGQNNSPTYRILKGNSGTNSPLFASGTISMTAGYDVPDQTVAKDYYVEDLNHSFYYTNTGAYYPDSYFAQHVESTSGCLGCHPAIGHQGPVTSVYARLTQWCAQCHTRYHASDASGADHTDSGDSVFGFRHRTNLDNRPMGQTSDCLTCHIKRHSAATPHTTYPGCLTCHVSHGTGARMGNYSGSVAWPDSSTVSNGNDRSSLLRLDGRGVCMQCHPWGTGLGGY